MAARRMIHTKISRSKQVNRMSDFAQLVFTWTIAHADDFGCIDGDPEVLLATVIPMRRDKEPEDMERAIIEWVSAELVWWFEIGNQKVVQFRTWDTHQSGLHKRTKSKYPMYQEVKSSEKFRELPRNSALTELNRTEQNRTEMKGTEEKELQEILGVQETVGAALETNNMNSSFSLDLEFGQVISLYKSEGYGDVTESIKGTIEYLYDTYGFVWLTEAIKEAVFQNKRRLAYVQSILQNWKADGGMRRSGGERSGGYQRNTPKTTATGPVNEYRKDKPGAY